jgi:hypothetical protein
MCGRVRLPTDYSEIKIRLRFDATAPAPNVAPSWNTPPTGDMLVATYTADGKRISEVMLSRNDGSAQRTSESSPRGAYRAFPFARPRTVSGGVAFGRLSVSVCMIGQSPFLYRKRSSFTAKNGSSGVGQFQPSRPLPHGGLSDVA